MTNRDSTSQIEEPPITAKPVLTVPEAAQLLGISRALAYNLVASGDIPSVRVGRRIIVPRRAIDALLARATPCDGQFI